MRLEGKVALVTGGTRGIGRGIVEGLANEGASVGFTGRSKDLGHQLEDAVRSAGGRALYIAADSGVEEEVAGAVRTTVEHFGHLTTLVSSAISDDAGSGNDSHIDVVENTTFDNIMRIALYGTFWAASTPSPKCAEPAAGRSSTFRPPRRSPRFRSGPPTMLPRARSMR